MYNKFILLIFCFGLLLISACGDQSTAVPVGITATATSIPEISPTGSVATNTPTLVPATLPSTPTFPPTLTLPPSNTPAPTPVATSIAVPETTTLITSPTTSTATPTAIKITPTVSATTSKTASLAAKPISDDSSPCTVGQVKGNRNSKIYHTPGQRDYAKTKSNVECFDTEAQAQAAGYRHALR